MSGLAEVLAAHGPSGSVNSREGWVECECGERLYLPSGLTFDGYPEMWDEERKARDAHLAVVVLAHIEAVAGDAAVREVCARAEWDALPATPHAAVGAFVGALGLGVVTDGREDERHTETEDDSEAVRSAVNDAQGHLEGDA